MASSSVVGLEAVGAGQVEHPQRAAIGGGAFALAPFDRDARVVSHLLAAAGQAVEQRGLAAVRHADQRDAQGPGFDDGVHGTRTRAARSAQAAAALVPSGASAWRAAHCPRVPAARAPPRLRRAAARTSSRRCGPRSDRHPATCARRLRSAHPARTRDRAGGRAVTRWPRRRSSMPAVADKPVDDGDFAAPQLGERMGGAVRESGGASLDFTAAVCGSADAGSKCDEFAFASWTSITQSSTH